MDSILRRRRFLQLGAVAAGGAVLAPWGGPFRPAARAADEGDASHPHRGRIFKAIKVGMFREDISVEEKFEVLRDLGFDGVEMASPGGVDKDAALAASRETGLPIHGAVDSIHWGVRLSDPDPEVRERSLEGLRTAIRDVHRVGGSAVLLVPGKVTDPERENSDQVWSRSIEGIRKALPLAARLGVHILIENVWNGFLYDPEGGPNQTAEPIARYIDAIDSPWVGSYFDIGNHQRYGRPAQWIRTLGRRIVKLDVKDWGQENGFCKIGDGDVDWAEVREALRDIRFTGWATAEVSGGDRERIGEIGERMDRVLGL